MDNLQTNKKYFIPMEVTPETIKEFGIKSEDVQWTKIGNKPVKVIMVPSTKEQYYEYMRPLWREDKRQQRQESMASLDKLYEETEYEIADKNTNIEEMLTKKFLIKELHKALEELEEIDRIIMKMYSRNCTETEIGQAVDMSQRGVGKRKQRILLKLRIRLEDFR